jgi:hypothetical protein
MTNRSNKSSLVTWSAAGASIPQRGRPASRSIQFRRYVQLYQSGQLERLGISDPGRDPLPVEDNETNRVLQLRRELAAVRQERSDLLKEKELRDALLRMFRFIGEAEVSPPAWVMRTPRAGSRAAIPTAFLSDVHLDEVVYPAQVNYVNAFNRPNR